MSDHENIRQSGISLLRTINDVIILGVTNKSKSRLIEYSHVYYECFLWSLIQSDLVFFSETSHNLKLRNGLCRQINIDRYQTADQIPEVWHVTQAAACATSRR